MNLTNFDKEKSRYKHTGTELSIEDVEKMNIPKDIIDIIKDWGIIWKSPYSDTLYNTKDVSWGIKPDKSLRVSDHWNFQTRGRKHCVSDKNVPNKTHVSLGLYDKSNKRYVILKTSTAPSQIKIHKRKETYKKFLLSPEILAVKKKFKEDIANGNVNVEAETKNGEKIHGIIHKYTKSKIILKTPNGETWTKQHIKRGRGNATPTFKYLKLIDNRTGDEILDPFGEEFEKQFEHPTTFEPTELDLS